MEIKKNTIICLLIIVNVVIIILALTSLFNENKSNTKPNNIIKEDVNKEIKENNINDDKQEEKIEIKETKQTKKEEKNTVTETKKDVKNENKVIVNNEKSEIKTKESNNADNTKDNTNNVEVSNKQENTEVTEAINIVSDKSVIPDKYNTGSKGSLKKYTPEMELGITFKMSGNTPVINFTNKQNHISEVTIKDIDFTNYDKVAIYGGGEDVTDIKIKLTFKNCKFNSITTASNLDTDITILFENCSIKSFGGSNASFNKCFFGGSSHDGMNPHRNITVKNSYFAGTNTYDANNARHYDGVQIYGSNTIDNLLVENLKFYNCRFEVPAINEVRNGVPSKSGVNAPIMFALEYDNGNNVTFENIIANGGGYSVYASTKNGVSYKNLTFKNIKLGYAHLFGILYPMTDANKANTKFINFGYYDSLYVSSVWKDSKGVHIITTNDTLIERKLTCETDKGNFNFTMKAHPKLTRENNSTFKFSQMPYDIDNTIKDNSIKYIKCYDTTEKESLEQSNLIRTQKF